MVAHFRNALLRRPRRAVNTLSENALEPQRAISLGHPSYVWRRGQERRLRLLRRYVTLEGKRILDVGCGLGLYVSAFRRFTPHAYGADIDPDRIKRASLVVPNLLVAEAERLPFRDGSFDVVVLNEVVEHVRDDRAAIAEACRVTRAGGHVAVYAPNRLYPFETHGFYLGSRYVFGLAPLVNYTPDAVRRLFCPHVRVYTGRGLRALFASLPVRLIVVTHIYPALDNVRARWPRLGRWLQRAAEFLEETPLRRLGISHFLVAQKLVAPSPAMLSCVDDTAHQR